MKGLMSTERNGKINSFFKNTEGGLIHCTLIGEHQPEAAKECIIYFAPLFEERMWSQRIAFNFALEIWKQTSQPVLIYDYYGYGESDGDSEDFSLSQTKKDIEAITRHLNDEFGISKYTFWGIRTGCAVALNLVSTVKNVTSMVFWAPVFDLKDYIIKSLRSTISAQLFMFREILASRDEIIDELLKKDRCIKNDTILNNIDGYRFSKKMFLECMELSAGEMLHKLHCPSLILEVAPKNRNYSSKSKDHEFASLPNITYKMSFEKQFWLNSLDYSQRSDETYHITLEWLKKHLAIGDR